MDCLPGQRAIRSGGATPGRATGFTSTFTEYIPGESFCLYGSAGFYFFPGRYRSEHFFRRRAGGFRRLLVKFHAGFAIYGIRCSD